MELAATARPRGQQGDETGSLAGRIAMGRVGGAKTSINRARGIYLRADLVIGDPWEKIPSQFNFE